MTTLTAIPPGGTYFDTLKRSFVDVPVDKEADNAISTNEFLEAAESLTTLFGMYQKLSQFPHLLCTMEDYNAAKSRLRCLFRGGLSSLYPSPWLGTYLELTCLGFEIDVLGSVAFKPVKSDMIGNIKVRCYDSKNRHRGDAFWLLRLKVLKRISVA